MRKGVDPALFKAVKVDNHTGKVVGESVLEMRPPYGVKELKRRAAARKAAKQARKRNR
jgi:hypothetical protein